MYLTMTEKHAHSDPLDALGFEPIQKRLGITRQTWRNWKRKGVPKAHKEIVAMMCSFAGVDAEEIISGCERKLDETT